MADMSEFTQLQNAHMEAILGSDSEDPFLTFISDLRSDSEEKVSEAKSMFEMMKDRDPESFATKLSNCLAAPNSDVATREDCAELLRKLLTDDEHLFTWHSRLSVSTQSNIKSILLDCIKLEQDSDFVIRQLRYTIYKLSLSILPDNNWPELLPLLIHYLTHSNSRNFLKGSAFWIFAGLATHIGKTLVHCVKPLHSLFLTTLNDHTLDLNLRIQATRAVLKFIQHVPVTSNEKERFQKLLAGMMTTLTDTLSNCDKAEDLLDCFISLALTDPKFFRLHLRVVVSSMLEIAQNENLETKTRHQAIEFVLSLVEARQKAPGMMKKIPLFTQTCFAVLLNLLLDIKDESSCHSADTNIHDRAGLTDNLEYGRQSLHRFSIALGGKTIAHVAMEQLRAYLVAPEWKKRHAALDALIYITDGSSKVLIKYLQQLVNMVLRSFQDPHPQVKWAGIRAIHQFSVDLCPVFQEQYHNQILPALAEAMDDSKDARVQELAATALGQFCIWTMPQTLVPYQDKLLNKLLILLQSDNQMVLEAALGALRRIVFVLKGRFEKYYDVVVPHVKFILVNVNNKSNHNLLRCALGCSSVVAFGDDLKQVMEMLQLLQESQVKELYTIESILTAYCIICRRMGKDFLPYMKIVIPTLVECAQLEPDKTVSSYEVNESMHKVKFGDAIICVSGSEILYAKYRACYMLGEFASQLKEDFYPWISQVASILVPLLKFYIDDEVREEASLALHKLLHSAEMAIEKGTTQGGNLSYFKQLSDDIIMALGDALYSEPNTEICAHILSDLNDCLQICGPLLDEDQIGGIIDEINYVMKESSQRKGELAEREKSEDFDDEDAELMTEEREQEVEVFQNVGYILSTLIETFKADILPYVDKLLFYLIPGEDATAKVRQTCILIFTMIVEHCGESAIKYYKIYLPFLLDSSNDEYPGARQNALFGLGLCAEYDGYSFKPFIGEALSRINVIITHCNALEPENVMAYDNAVSALGKICQFHQESVDTRKIIPAWLNCLPIKDDLAKTKGVHDQLCSMVERSDEEIWGHNYLHLPKVISIFTEVLCAGDRDNLVTEETAKRMINLLRNFKQRVPQATWASTWPLLLPQQAMELESILSDEDDLNISTCYETTSLENV